MGKDKVISGDYEGKLLAYGDAHGYKVQEIKFLKDDPEWIERKVKEARLDKYEERDKYRRSLKKSTETKKINRKIGVCIIINPDATVLFDKKTFKDGSALVEINTTTVENYEILSEESSKSASSSIARGLVGGVLLGPLGMVAGAVTGGKNHLYRIVVNFKDGKRSLLELGSWGYELFLKEMFKS